MSHRPARTKKPLGQLLAELSNPKPDRFDPENEGADGLRGNKGSDDEDSNDDFGYEDEDSKREHYLEVGKGRIRTGLGVQLNDEMEEKYKGARVSRKSLANEFSEEEEDSEEDSEGDEEEDGMEQDEDDQDEEEDASDSDEEESSSGEEDDSEEEEEEEDSEARSAQVASELKKMALKEKELLKNLASTSNGDVEKGQHVKNQQAIWESLLDLRINLQPALSSANILPTPDTFPAFSNPSVLSKTAISSTTNSLHTATTLVTSLIHDLLETRANLLVKNETVSTKPADFAKKYLKRKRGDDSDGEQDEEEEEEQEKEVSSEVEDDDSTTPKDTSKQLTQLWKTISSFDTSFSHFRDSTLEKWSNKVMASAALNVNQGKKFKAINQSAVAQIRSVLSDKERLVKRTRLVRSGGGKDGSGRHLGYVAPETQAEADAAASVESGEVVKRKTDLEEVEELHEKELSRKNKSNASDLHLSNFDEEVFDDGDYYQQLLKELIEGRLLETDDPALLSMKWAELKQLQAKTKKKKDVDTKASKGRKIRYAVHEKLQNFMAPEPRGSWHDAMVDELFGSLFGKVAQQQVVEQEMEEAEGAAEDSVWGEIQ
ncbi:hypothetical protein HDU98_004414, partial [Podochytrium sp. JEL0797]